MSTKPMLQLALDYIALPPAMAMAHIIKNEVDIIEIGTPLCKAEGMRAVAAIRALCPDNLILADVKPPMWARWRQRSPLMPGPTG